MKIYLAHSTGFDFANELYQPIQSSELFQKHTWIFPHADHSFINSKEILKDVDLIIAEVSYPSTGMGIELGWANMLGKRIVCINKSDRTVSSALKAVSSENTEYQDANDLVRILEDRLLL
jgi:nucleoside 2-deoxyribosyltransferase